MSGGPYISVCIPVYNGEAHLRKCLLSVATQEGVKLEVVVRDDGSSDGSLEIVRRVALEFPGVEWNIESNSTNLGMVGNWNACLMAARGEFMKMMGQDDLLEPQCLLKQVQALLANSNAALCISAANLYSAQGHRLFRKRRHWREGIHSGQKIILDCVRRAYNPLGEPVTGLARRESMVKHGGYDESFSYWVDVDMWFRLIESSTCLILREALCGFRIHRGAASFKLQGDSYGEFREIAKRYASGSAASRRSLAQRVRAGVDSLARLAIYRIFG